MALIVRAVEWYIGRPEPVYVHHLTILIARWSNLHWTRSNSTLYARLDECVSNKVQSFGRYDVVIHVDSCFL